MIRSVPFKINKQVKNLMDKLNAEFEPEFVPVIIEPYAKMQQCFGNVEAKIKRDGGSSHYGWAVWQSDIICEGERHAVWKSPEGNLVDITPRDTAIDKIFFISDNNLIYKGQLIDNVRINISSNKIVDDYILVIESIEILFTYGKRANENEINLPVQIRTLQCRLEEVAYILLEYILFGGTPQTQCFCEEKLSYEDCHGNTLKQDVQFNLQKIDSMFKERPLK